MDHPDTAAVVDDVQSLSVTTRRHVRRVSQTFDVDVGDALERLRRAERVDDRRVTTDNVDDVVQLSYSPYTA